MIILHLCVGFRQSLSLDTYETVVDIEQIATYKLLHSFLQLLFEYQLLNSADLIWIFGFVEVHFVN